MTIAIGLAVPDGIALAADTQTTWTRTIDKAIDKGSGQEFELADPIQLPVGWSRLARKLFRLSVVGKEFAIVVAGAALINQKTPYSIFKSREQTYTGDGSYDSFLQHLIDGVKAEMLIHFGVADLKIAPIMFLDFILAGYDGADVSKPILRAVGVYSGSPSRQDGSGVVTHWRNDDSPNRRFTICWIGRGEFVSHVVSHTNAQLPSISSQYSLLTLADAEDYVRFLAEFTCDFQRFAVMVPDCGRPVIAATLTPERYSEKAGTLDR